MSTILKALRRLEEQRTQGEGRPLREEVATGPRASEPASSSRRGIRWAAAGLAAVAFGVAGGLALWQWVAGEDAALVDVAAQPTPAAAPVPVVDAGEARARSRVAQPRSPRARAPTRVPPAPAAGALPSALPAPPDRADELPAGLPEQAFASPVEVVPRPPAEPRKPIGIARAADPLPGREAAETPSETPPAPAPAPAPASGPVVAKSEAVPPPSPFATPVPKPAVAPTPRPSAVPAPERIAAAEPEPAPEPKRAIEPEPAPEAPAPVVDAEPQEFTARASEPSEPAESTPEPRAEAAASAASPRPEVPPAPANLLVAKTLWHPQAERRVAFVSLDGAPPRRIQEGDVVGRYVVSEIQPSGVVFLDDGEKVRRAVGAK